MICAWSIFLRIMYLSAAHLSKGQSGQRRLLRRLEDHRAANRQRRTRLPRHHRQREVPLQRASKRTLPFVFFYTEFIICGCDCKK